MKFLCFIVVLLAGITHAESLINGPVSVIDQRFGFTEGPACEADGNIIFSDIRKKKIYRWSKDGSCDVVWTFDFDTAGLYFDSAWKLFACSLSSKRIISIAKDGTVTEVAGTYSDQPFNQPNDLWVDAQGGIYFTDPMFGKDPKTQDGHHVYYIQPDRSETIRVCDDFVRPNGVIGTPDGKTLYISDYIGNKVWKYDVQKDGTLTNKTLFAKRRCDGFTLDEYGNLYITDKNVHIYSKEGNLLESITGPEGSVATNVTFGGGDGKTLLVTARNIVFTVPMKVRGVYNVK